MSFGKRNFESLYEIGTIVNVNANDTLDVLIPGRLHPYTELPVTFDTRAVTAGCKVVVGKAHGSPWMPFVLGEFGSPYNDWDMDNNKTKFKLFFSWPTFGQSANRQFSITDTMSSKALKLTELALADASIKDERFSRIIRLTPTKIMSTMTQQLNDFVDFDFPNGEFLPGEFNPGGINIWKNTGVQDIGLILDPSKTEDILDFWPDPSTGVTYAIVTSVRAVGELWKDNSQYNAMSPVFPPGDEGVPYTLLARTTTRDAFFGATTPPSADWIRWGDWAIRAYDSEFNVIWETKIKALPDAVGPEPSPGLVLADINGIPVLLVLVWKETRKLINTFSGNGDSNLLQLGIMIFNAADGKLVNSGFLNWGQPTFTDFYTEVTVNGNSPGFPTRTSPISYGSVLPNYYFGAENEDYDFPFTNYPILLSNFNGTNHDENFFQDFYNRSSVTSSARIRKFASLGLNLFPLADLTQTKPSSPVNPVHGNSVWTKAFPSFEKWNWLVLPDIKIHIPCFYMANQICAFPADVDTNIDLGKNIWHINGWEKLKDVGSPRILSDDAPINPTQGETTPTQGITDNFTVLGISDTSPQRVITLRERMDYKRYWVKVFDLNAFERDLNLASAPQNATTTTKPGGQVVVLADILNTYMPGLAPPPVGTHPGDTPGPLPYAYWVHTTGGRDDRAQFKTDLMALLNYLLFGDGFSHYNQWNPATFSGGVFFEGNYSKWVEVVFPVDHELDLISIDPTNGKVMASTDLQPNVVDSTFQAPIGDFVWGQIWGKVWSPGGPLDQFQNGNVNCWADLGIEYASIGKFSTWGYNTYPPSYFQNAFLSTGLSNQSFTDQQKIGFPETNIFFTGDKSYTSTFMLGIELDGPSATINEDVDWYNYRFVLNGWNTGGKVDDGAPALLGGLEIGQILSNISTRAIGDPIDHQQVWFNGPKQFFGEKKHYFGYRKQADGDYDGVIESVHPPSDPKFILKHVGPELMLFGFTHNTILDLTSSRPKPLPYHHLHACLDSGLVIFGPKSRKKSGWGSGTAGPKIAADSDSRGRNIVQSNKVKAGPDADFNMYVYDGTIVNAPAFNMGADFLNQKWVTSYFPNPPDPNLPNPVNADLQQLGTYDIPHARITAIPIDSKTVAHKLVAYDALTCKKVWESEAWEVDDGKKSMPVAVDGPNNDKNESIRSVIVLQENDGAVTGEFSASLGFWDISNGKLLQEVDIEGWDKSSVSDTTVHPENAVTEQWKSRGEPYTSDLPIWVGQNKVLTITRNLTVGLIEGIEE